jgi:hypothetical protein
MLMCLCGAVTFVSSCKKSSMTTPTTPPSNPPAQNPPPSTSSNNFFKNTDWTGVAGTYGQTYQQPCNLHFNGDTTVTLYALFNMVIGTSLTPFDSLVGKITAIDASNTSAITISVNFPFTNDQQIYTITDQNTLKGGSSSTTSAASNTQFTVQTQICPAVIPSISGTGWNTDKMVGGPTDGMYEFPDINALTFGTDGKTFYVRGGKFITYTPPDQIQLILYEWVQIGYRIYFAGYNEATDKLIGYYGVLSPDGNTILADARNRSDTRLPYYFQTIYWYGPPGVTPTMHKAN